MQQELQDATTLSFGPSAVEANSRNHGGDEGAAVGRDATRTDITLTLTPTRGNRIISEHRHHQTNF